MRPLRPQPTCKSRHKAAFKYGGFCTASSMLCLFRLDLSKTHKIGGKRVCYAQCVGIVKNGSRNLNLESKYATFTRLFFRISGGRGERWPFLRFYEGAKQSAGMEFLELGSGLSWWYNEQTEEMEFQFEDCLGG